MLCSCPIYTLSFYAPTRRYTPAFFNVPSSRGCLLTGLVDEFVGTSTRLVPTHQAGSAKIRKASRIILSRKFRVHFLCYLLKQPLAECYTTLHGNIVLARSFISTELNNIPVPPCSRYVSQVAVGRRPCLSVHGDDYDTQDGTGVSILYFLTAPLAFHRIMAIRG